MSVYRRYKGKRIKHGSKDYDKGTWYYMFRIRGKLYHKSIPEARTKAQAERVEATLVSDILNKRYGMQSEVSFTEFADKIYLKYCEQHNENYYVKELFVEQLKKFFGSRKLSDITAQDCRDFQYHRLHTKTKLGGKRSPASVNKETSTLSKLFSLACEQGLLHDSPMRWVKKLKEAPPRRYVLTDEQKERLWQELEQDTLLLRLTVLATNLPLRRAQLLAISPDAIDMQNGVLFATASKGKPERIVPLNSTALNTLHLMMLDKQLPFPLRVFQKRWKKILVAAGINKLDGTREENFHFHDLRTWFGSELLKRGVSAYHIKELFNHSSIEVSAIYLSPDHSQLSEAVKRLDVIESEVIQ